MGLLELAQVHGHPVPLAPEEPLGQGAPVQSETTWATTSGSTSWCRSGAPFRTCSRRLRAASSSPGFPGAPALSSRIRATASLSRTHRSSSAGGDKAKYMEIKMQQVLVSKVVANGEANEEGFPSEKVSFSYGKIKWIYTQQKRTDGLGGGNVNSGWDLTANKAIA